MGVRPAMNLLNASGSGRPQDGENDHALKGAVSDLPAEEPRFQGGRDGCIHLLHPLRLRRLRHALAQLELRLSVVSIVVIVVIVVVVVIVSFECWN
jgi:hypothetical protein